MDLEILLYFYNTIPRILLGDNFILFFSIWAFDISAFILIHK